MDVKNKLYKNQGIHVISTIFTVEKGNVKVLLIKRKNEPYKDMWALVGGALYNNEDVEEGMYREIKEKTGIEDVTLYFNNVFGKVDRSPIFRMVALNYIGVISANKLNTLTNEFLAAIDRASLLSSDRNNIVKLSLNNDKASSFIL